MLIYSAVNKINQNPAFMELMFYRNGIDRKISKVVDVVYKD